MEPGPGSTPQACDPGLQVGAGEGNRTLMTSLEGWGSAIELRPHSGCALRVAYRVAAAEMTLTGASVTGADCVVGSA